MQGGSVSELRIGHVISARKSRRKPSTVAQDATIRSVAESMLKNRETRKVYVVSEEGKLLGTITLETLLRHAGYSLGVRSPGVTSLFRMLSEIQDEKAKDIMVKSAKVSEDELLLNAARLMVENHLNDLPVVDGKSDLIGELNGLDIIAYGSQFWE